MVERRADLADAARNLADLERQLAGGVKGGSDRTGFDPKEAAILRELVNFIPPARAGKVLVGAAKGIGSLMSQ